LFTENCIIIEEKRGRRGIIYKTGHAPHFKYAIVV
jgi:hypothetical protein